LIFLLSTIFFSAAASKNPYFSAIPKNFPNFFSSFFSSHHGEVIKSSTDFTPQFSLVLINHFIFNTRIGFLTNLDDVLTLTARQNQLTDSPPTNFPLECKCGAPFHLP